MAIATAKCTCRRCGKEFEIRVKKYNRDEANRFEAWAAANIDLCRDCEREEEREAAEARAEKNHLPALTGSEKQIAWATTIRDKFIQQSEAEIDRITSQDNRYTACETCLLRAILDDKTAASWWIDHRYDSNYRYVLVQLLQSEAEADKNLAEEMKKQYESLMPAEDKKGAEC